VGFGYVVEERGGRREEARIGHGERLERSGSDRHVRNGEEEEAQECVRIRKTGEGLCCLKYHTQAKTS